MKELLYEINRIKELSGLLVEQGGAFRNLIPYIDNLITPAMKAMDSELDALVRKGIRNLTDGELFKLLSKLPPKSIAKLIVDNNIIFSERLTSRLKQDYLNKLVKGEKTWSDVVNMFEQNSKTLWGTNPNLPESVYTQLKPILDEVGIIYKDNLEKFIRESLKDSPDEIVKIFGRSLGKSLGEGITNFLKWVGGKQGFILTTVKNGTRSYDSLYKEADDLMKQIVDEYVKNGANANISRNVRRLTELATAAKNKNTGIANDLLNEWLKDSNIPLRVRQKIKLDDWYKEWVNILEEYSKRESSKLPSLFSGINDYRIALGRILPNSDASWSERFKRIANLISYSTPQLRSEIIGRLGTKGVSQTVASRMAGHFLQVTVVIPGIIALGQHLLIDPFIPGDQGKYKDKFFKWFPKLNEFPLLSPLSWTYLDNLWRAGKFIFGSTDEEILEGVGDTILGEDYNETREVMDSDNTSNNTDLPETLKNQSSPEQQQELRYNESKNQYYLTSEEFPLYEQNGTWYVNISGKFYKLEDIRKQ